MKRRDSMEDWQNMMECYNKLGYLPGDQFDRFNGRVKYPADVPKYGFGGHGYQPYNYGVGHGFARQQPIVDTTDIMFDGDTHDWQAVIIHASDPYEIDHEDFFKPLVVSVIDSPKTQVATIQYVPEDACTRGYLQSRFNTVADDLKATLEDLLKSARAAVPVHELTAISAIKARIATARETVEIAARVLIEPKDQPIEPKDLPIEPNDLPIEPMIA